MPGFEFRFDRGAFLSYGSLGTRAKANFPSKTFPHARRVRTAKRQNVPETHKNAARYRSRLGNKTKRVPFVRCKRGFGSIPGEFRAISLRPASSRARDGQTRRLTVVAADARELFADGLPPRVPTGEIRRREKDDRRLYFSLCFRQTLRTADES